MMQLCVPSGQFTDVTRSFTAINYPKPYPSEIQY